MAPAVVVCVALGQVDPSTHPVTRHVGRTAGTGQTQEVGRVSSGVVTGCRQRPGMVGAPFAQPDRSVGQHADRAVGTCCPAVVQRPVVIDPVLFTAAYLLLNPPAVFDQQVGLTATKSGCVIPFEAEA